MSMVRILALCALLVPSAAFARPAPDHVKPSPALARLERLAADDSADDQRARVAMERFAHCIVDRDPARVKAIAGLPLAEVYPANWEGLAAPGCADRSMRFQASFLRAALFRDLYVRREAVTAQRGSWDFPVVAYDPGTWGDPGKWPLLPADAALLALSDCLVNSDRDSAAKFVVAPAASPDEAAAFVALSPKIAGCYPARGSQLLSKQLRFLSKSLLRGGVAEILYRDAVAAPAREAGK